MMTYASDKISAKLVITIRDTSIELTIEEAHELKKLLETICSYPAYVYTFPPSSSKQTPVVYYNDPGSTGR